MSVTDDYRQIGGFWGGCNKLIDNVLKDSSNKYYLSTQCIINSKDNHAKAKEIQMAFKDKNHPMHYFISCLFMKFLVTEVAENAKTLSYGQLMEKYQDGFLVDVGISLAEIDYKREIDKKNGHRGSVKRAAVTEQIKNEIASIYYSRSSLWDLPATDVATRIHKDLIAFLQKAKFKKKDYSPRVIASFICEIRKKKTIPFRGDKGNP